MPNRSVSPVQIEVAADEEPFVDFIEAHFDSDFYLRIHVDVAKAGIDAAEHFFTHGIGENRRISLYVDMHHGVDASLSLDRTWKTFRWRGNPIAVRLVSGQGHDVPAADGGRRSFFARFGRAFGRRRLPVIAQVGNPFESVGRSEHIRTIWRALRAASVRATIYDVYGHVPDARYLPRWAIAASTGLPTAFGFFISTEPRCNTRCQRSKNDSPAFFGEATTCWRRRGNCPVPSRMGEGVQSFPRNLGTHRVRTGGLAARGLGANFPPSQCLRAARGDTPG